MWIKFINHLPLSSGNHHKLSHGFPFQLCHNFQWKHQDTHQILHLIQVRILDIWLWFGDTCWKQRTGLLLIHIGTFFCKILHIVPKHKRCAILFGELKIKINWITCLPMDVLKFAAGSQNVSRGVEACAQLKTSWDNENDFHLRLLHVIAHFPREELKCMPQAWGSYTAQRAQPITGHYRSN